jgi:hypothetical protein
MSKQGTVNVEALAQRAKKKADVERLEARQAKLKEQLDEANAVRAASLAKTRELLPEYNDLSARLVRLRKAQARDAAAMGAAEQEEGSQANAQ